MHPQQEHPKLALLNRKVPMGKNLMCQSQSSVLQPKEGHIDASTSLVQVIKVVMDVNLKGV